MSHESAHDKKIAAAIESIGEKEAGKRMLYDKEIGGPMALRPSDDFIRDNIGEFKDQTEIRKEAEGRVWAQEKSERDARENKAEFDRSVREHNARIERGGGPHSNRDELRREQGRDNMSGRDRLRQDRDASGQQLDHKGPNRINIDR